MIQLVQLLNRLDHDNRLAASAETNGLRDAAVVIQQVQKIQQSASHPLTKLEVNLSDVLRVFGTKQRPYLDLSSDLGRCRQRTEANAAHNQNVWMALVWEYRSNHQGPTTC